MEYKYIKVNPDKFKIEFNGVLFRNIHEFIIDFKNIFTQMDETYKKFKIHEEYFTEQERKEQIELMKNKLKKLKVELEKKLDYITDSNKVSNTLIGKERHKLLQLKSLSQSIDTTKDFESGLNSLINFYNNRVVEKRVAVTKKIY